MLCKYETEFSIQTMTPNFSYFPLLSLEIIVKSCQETATVHSCWLKGGNKDLAPVITCLLKGIETMISQLKLLKTSSFINIFLSLKSLHLLYNYVF